MFMLLSYNNYTLIPEETLEHMYFLNRDSEEK